MEKTSSESGANSVIQQRLKRSSFSCVASAWSTWQGRSVWEGGRAKQWGGSLPQTACGAGGAGGGGRCLGPATVPTALTIVQSRSDTSMKRGRRARQAGVCPEPDMFTTALTEVGRLPGSCRAAGSCA